MENISANTVLIGKEIKKLPTCHSTNDEMMKLFKACQVNEGDMLVTEFQTAGKGQRGNVWMSNSGENLLFSFFIVPDFLKIQEQFMLNVFTSLALVKSLEQLGVEDIKIKWPNDVYIKDNKIAGILIENILKGDKLSASVIGIGFNVNQSSFEGLSHATSLFLESGKQSDKNDVLTVMNYYLSQQYLLLKNSKETLKEEYLKKLFGFQEKRHFKADTIFEGKIVGVNEIGQLMIERHNNVLCFGFKEVEFIL